MQIQTAIIGGSGVYDSGILTGIKSVTVRTVYGTVQVEVGDFQGQSVAFLPRHGKGHEIPPHKINYRANIAALKVLGVRNLFSTAAVGSINKAYTTGSIVLADQFLDFTKYRQSTFYDGSEFGVAHVDVTNPYCSRLRKVMEDSGKQLGYDIYNGGTYVCVEGPRFETKAEIEFFSRIGGDLVGMTNVPEVVLAREAGLCYAVAGLVTNYAAGISTAELTHEEVLEVVSQNSEKVRKLFYQSLGLLSGEQRCSCTAGVPELQFQGEINVED